MTICVAVTVWFAGLQPSTVVADSIITKSVRGNDILIPIPVGFDPVCEKNIKLWEVANKGSKVKGEHLLSCFIDGTFNIAVNLSLFTLDAPYDEKQWQEFKLTAVKSSRELGSEFSSDVEAVTNEMGKAINKDALSVDEVEFGKATTLFETTNSLATMRSATMVRSDGEDERILLRVALNLGGQLYIGGSSIRKKQHSNRHTKRFQEWAEKFVGHNSK